MTDDNRLERDAGATEAVPAMAGWERLEDDGFMALVGPIWTRQDGPKAAFGFLAEPKHANLIDVVQGGMLMTFADRALGLMAWRAAQNRPSVTIQLDMQFVTSANLGDFVEIEPEVVRLTNSLVFMRGTLTAGSRIVATAHGIWKIRGQ